MKVAIAYSTKDRVELTKQTIKALRDFPGDVFWNDGSTTEEGRALQHLHAGALSPRPLCTRVTGGADAAIVFALTQMLEGNYDVIGVCENDVLLHDGWFARTIRLFEQGTADGLAVGAVSPRCYEDRILIQRGGYAVCHNLGAGIVLYTREAARIILDNYRTGWWHDNRAAFAQLAGIDIGRYAAFRGNEQHTTADWHFDAVLAQHGLASLALTPSMCDMIGQEPSLEEQGLVLARGEAAERYNGTAFERFSQNLIAIGMGWTQFDAIKPIHTYMGTQTIFAHQIGTARTGDWRLRWSQGFGPFAYRANENDCVLRAEVFGPATFLVSGGKNGAKVTLTDTESGYEISPDLPAGEGQIAQIQMPAGMSYRQIVMTCGEGAVFYGVQTVETQPITNHKFDYHSLPPV